MLNDYHFWECLLVTNVYNGKTIKKNKECETVEHVQNVKISEMVRNSKGKNIQDG